MKKQLIFTFALLLFSNISITMDTVSADSSEENSVETATITIQITHKEYLQITSHKEEEIQSIKKNLSAQEIRSAYIETPVNQIRPQLRNKNTPNWQILLRYEGGKIFDYLKNDEHLSLEITYKPDNKSKNIKGDVEE